MCPQSPLKSLFLPQRIRTMRKYSPRTSLNGTPMTSWTKWKIQSLRIHRVTSLGGEGVAYSCLTQFSHNGVSQGFAGFLGHSSLWLPGVHNTSS